MEVLDDNFGQEEEPKEEKEVAYEGNTLNLWQRFSLVGSVQWLKLLAFMVFEIAVVLFISFASGDTFLAVGIIFGIFWLILPHASIEDNAFAVQALTAAPLAFGFYMLMIVSLFEFSIVYVPFITIGFAFMLGFGIFILYELPSKWH